MLNIYFIFCSQANLKEQVQFFPRTFLYPSAKRPKRHPRDIIIIIIKAHQISVLRQYSIPKCWVSLQELLNSAGGQEPNNAHCPHHAAAYQPSQSTHAITARGCC
jgi:hypothetical protein